MLRDSLTTILLRFSVNQPLAVAFAPRLLYNSDLDETTLQPKASAPDRTTNVASQALRPPKEGDGPDRSMADFFWCMMAAQGGWSIEETASKLLEVCAKAQERPRLRDEGCTLVTAQNAAAAATRGKQRGRG